jgi:small-conductance mechanosensitive channel
MFARRFLHWRRFEPRLALTAVVFGLACISSAQEPGSQGTNGSLDQSGATLELLNYPICVFRGTIDGYSPAERRAAAAARLDTVLAASNPTLVTTQAVPAGIQIRLGKYPLFVIAPSDLSGLTGQTLDQEAEQAASALRSALYDRNTLSGRREILIAVANAVAGLVFFVVLVLAFRRGKGWLLARSARLAASKTANLRARRLRTAGLRSFVTVLRALLNLSFYLFVALLSYVLLCYELRRFPYSRPWGDYLRAQAVSVLKALGHNALDAVPDLMVVVLVVLVARMLAHVVSRLCTAAERGEIETTRLDPSTAGTTRRLLVLLIWVIAILIAHPYIPGSQSLAFKGVTIFLGVLVSLGSSNLVNQVASGLLLIYSHAFRVGDYVRIGEIEGTILKVGLCLTHVRTVKNEEVQIANTVLLGTATRNFSRFAKSDGLWLPVKVTIGYGTPWRQVHAMLVEAANKTAGLAGEPLPFVLQTNLSDFYVEYELNACLKDPPQRIWVLGELNSHIQDIFNEHGVQIMSPHYLQDPAKPQVVPPSNWFPPPASREKVDQCSPQEQKLPKVA